jgi:simple sugar transport system ATP-binding protein
MFQRRAEGAAVVFVSEDLDELRQLSDRIAVLHDGELAGIVEANAGTAEIGRMMLDGAVAA